MTAINNIKMSSSDAGPAVFDLPTGRLTAESLGGEKSVEKFCGFVGMDHDRSGFKVVGRASAKFFPIRPSDLERIAQTMAEKLAVQTLRQPVVFMTASDMAACLGPLVLEHYLHLTRAPITLLLASTRRRFLFPQLAAIKDEFGFDRQFIYNPANRTHQYILKNCGSLVLVEDVLMPGAAVFELAETMLRRKQYADRVVFLSASSWLSDDDKAEAVKKLNVQTNFVNLMNAKLNFCPADDLSFDEKLLVSPPMPQILPSLYAFNRPESLGLEQPLRLPEEIHGRLRLPDKKDKVLVIGVGEFVYQPFLLAKYLEKLGYDVHCQSTAFAPPAVLGGQLGNYVVCNDSYVPGGLNYVYNINAEEYDCIYVTHENDKLPFSCNLARQLNAEQLYFYR